MEQNKVRTYLFYAVGEIALVMIGILLALQVNNWNEEQKALTQLESNFTNLIEDIESNEAQLLQLIESRENRSAGAAYLIDNYEAGIPVAENEFINKLYPTLTEQYFEINRSGIDKVMSSEAFELEQMKEIRDLLKTYLRDSGTLLTFEIKENSAIEEMEMITAGNGYFRMVWRSFRNDRYKTTTEFNNPDYNFLQLMENDELLYILFRYEFVSKFALSGYHDLISKGDEIVLAIEQYKQNN